MPDPEAVLRERLAALSTAYAERLGERIAAIEAVWHDARATPAARTELRRLAHQLKGSGRTFGFPDVSATAAALERAVQALPESGALTPAQHAEVDALIGALRAAAARTST